MSFASKRVSYLIVGFLFITIGLTVLFFVIRHNDVREDGAKSNSKVSESVSDFQVKTKDLKSQEEIWPEYKENIGKLLETIKTMEGGSEEILQKTEAGFFGIFVPNNLREIHLDTLLEIQKMDQYDYFEDPEVFRSKIIPLLNMLLEQESSSN